VGTTEQTWSGGTRQPEATATQSGADKKAGAKAQPADQARKTPATGDQGAGARPTQPSGGTGTKIAPTPARPQTEASDAGHASTLSQLERDRAARSQGAKRTSNYSKQRSWSPKGGSSARSRSSSGGNRR